jgi:multidrug efflux pump subunit AcrB
MNFRNISAWSIRNPVVPIVLFIGLTLAGLLSFMTMEVQNDPDIEFPVVIATISQPGAAPTEIETQITQRVESAVRGIDGARNISSNANEGSSTTVVEFQIGVDVNQAVNEVKNAIDQIRGELPDGIMEPYIFKETTSSNPMAYFAVQASDMTMEQLSWFVDDTVSKRLMAIQGMGAVERSGGVDREIRVILDPARMQAQGVTAAQINNVLRQVNLNAAGGKAEIAGSRQSVRVLGNAVDAYALSQTQISLGDRTVKLADVASVSDGFSEQSRIGKIDGKQVVSFSIARAKGASDLTVFDAAEKVIAQIEKENPGVDIITMFNNVQYTKDQYHSSMLAMVEGAVLAVIVVFLFLRDWRATVISALAIPLSAIPTFWIMDLMGFTLNSLSLLALGLVAGVLVDDAIVEIENIVRHMRMGKSAYQASIDAADEIGLAVVATTFSIVAVFLPVGLMPGVSGQFFKNFGLTVVASVLISLAVARMITPMIAAYFLKSFGHAEHGGGWLMDRYMGVLRWSLDETKAHHLRAQLQRAPLRLGYLLVELIFVVLVIAAFAGAMFTLPQLLAPVGLWAWLSYVLAFSLALGAAYVVARLFNVAVRFVGGGVAHYHEFFIGRWMAHGQDHRVWVMGIGLVSFLIMCGLFVVAPKQFFPTVNTDSSQVRIEMVPGTTIKQTEAVADQVTRIIAEQPETKLVMEAVREGNASLFINLNEDRARTSMEFERQLGPRLSAIADARVYFQSQGGGGGTGRAISIMLSGSDPALLDRTAARLVEEMKAIPEVRGPRVNADMRRPELIIKPRLDLAAQMGVTTSALSQAIRIATLGDIDQNSAKFSLSDRQVPIRVMLPENSRRDLSTIENLPVPTASGGSVPLSRVAEIGFGSGPVTIQRYNQNRRVFVGADLATGAVKGTAMEKIMKTPVMTNLPAGVSNAPVGEDEWQAEMGRSFMIALGAGTLLVFAVLVLLYKRFMSPLVNMGSLLLAPLGGLIALLIIGQPLSMPVLIGILMLFGIVAKNSILLIDFAIEEMERGTAKFPAIMEAGHKRAQPIVMTTVAMVAGMIPTAISLTGDGAWRAPMGTVVIGGLILSTLLTLLIVPAAFSLSDGIEKRVGPFLRRRLLTYDPKLHGERPDPQPAE